MSEKDYPPLPEPHGYAPRTDGGGPLYTAKQMHAYLEADRAQRAQPEGLSKTWIVAVAKDCGLECTMLSQLFDFTARVERAIRLSAAPIPTQVPAHPEAPADPMDWPLPCDVKIGHGTHSKGTKLRFLVKRAQWLWEEASPSAQAAPQPDADLTAAYMAGFERGKDAAKAAQAAPDALTVEALMLDVAGENPLADELMAVWDAAVDASNKYPRLHGFSEWCGRTQAACKVLIERLPALHRAALAHTAIAASHASGSGVAHGGGE